MPNREITPAIKAIAFSSALAAGLVDAHGSPIEHMGRNYDWGERAAVCMINPSTPEAKKECKELRDTMKQNIVIYSASWCAPCKIEESFLESHGIKFTLYDVERDPERAQELIDLAGKAIVPVTVIGSGADRSVIFGLDENALSRVLGIKDANSVAQDK